MMSQGALKVVSHNRNKVRLKKILGPDLKGRRKFGGQFGSCLDLHFKWSISKIFAGRMSQAFVQTSQIISIILLQYTFSMISPSGGHNVFFFLIEMFPVDKALWPLDGANDQREQVYRIGGGFMMVVRMLETFQQTFFFFLYK